ncbi:TetR/AcrR family transcriptional regulator [Amycolatopsis sp. NPDC058986]|uniref:TetR/AcrR family transcriptional regulator n=1 Tax=unclassified Amycolatopsis TaxID=2618356 RepID=UPI00366CE6CA
MHTTHRTRNRRGEGSLLRQQILAAATELLDAGGDERTLTLRAVARRAGIAAPSIYPHFPGQAAIMLAIVRQSFAELACRLRAAAAGTDEPRQQLYAVCRTYLSYAREHPRRYRAMFGDFRHDGIAPEDLYPSGADMIRILADSLGARTSPDPADDAIALWLGLHGLAHQRAVLTWYAWPADIAQRVAGPLTRPVDGRHHPPVHGRTSIPVRRKQP